jgi:hypothetical protein
MQFPAIPGTSQAATAGGTLEIARFSRAIAASTRPGLCGKEIGANLA